MFGKKRVEAQETEKDPTVVQTFNKVTIYPEESRWDAFSRATANAAAAQKRQSSRNMRLSGGGMGFMGKMSPIAPGGLAGSIAMNVISRGGNTPAMAGTKPNASKPEIKADSLDLTTNSIRATYQGKIVLEGIYNKEHLLKVFTGAYNHNYEILNKVVPAPDRPNGRYSADRILEIARLKGELEEGAHGFISNINIITEIGVDKASFMGGKKFVVKMAGVEVPITINADRDASTAGLKDNLKMMAGMYSNMLHKKDDKKSYDKADYFVLEGASGVLTFEPEKNVAVTRYDIEIKDDDDKKNNIFVRTIMDNFATSIQPLLRNTVDAALLRTDKDKEMMLSETLLKAFYFDSHSVVVN